MQDFSRFGTPERTDETTTRESGGQWRRAALEVRRVRTLMSRVTLRGVIDSTPGRGSTSRGAMEVRQGFLVSQANQKGIQEVCEGLANKIDLLTQRTQALEVQAEQLKEALEKNS
ncbi:hypothetical protein NDU88_001862 [Pleurodeles waltl]|uniref:Uncharacterized protein n=1 Tax=Pleurodeles waltl TaxID=8319 RepID=A0AAV7UWL2_PLEWA|nr:hypothetical protein NDU88_001862 [Pleurodeles waltl]